MANFFLLNKPHAVKINLTKFNSIFQIQMTRPNYKQLNSVIFKR